MNGERIKKLPKWAQKIIQKQEEKIERIEKAHALLMDKEWFTVSNHERFTKLWSFCENQPIHVCSISPECTLLVGYDRKEK